MSSESAVTVDGVTKRYDLGVTRTAGTLREALSGLVRPNAPDAGTHVALDRVSFDVRVGEIFGVIGPNGAGKSTVLKAISGVTAIDEGQIRIRGRVGSLLEVGTGMHPDLTGRENIFLNGAVLGMRRAEVARKLEQIVEFAEVGEYLDTPVKRYSSGMAVRLAFAVASHLDAEVLLVDEVLAVGDARFQEKCVARMEAVAAEDDRTVLFVSHNMAPVRRMCDRVAVLVGGSVVFLGDPSDAVGAYFRGLDQQGQGFGFADLRQRDNPFPPGRLHLQQVTLRDGGEDPTGILETGGRCIVTVALTDMHLVDRPAVGIRITSDAGLSVVTSISRDLYGSGAPESDHTVSFEMDRLPVTPGRYSVDVSVVSNEDGRVVDAVTGAITFEASSEGMGRSDYRRVHGDGAVVVDSRWTVAAD